MVVITIVPHLDITLEYKHSDNYSFIFIFKRAAQRSAVMPIVKPRLGILLSTLVSVNSQNLIVACTDWSVYIIVKKQNIYKVAIVLTQTTPYKTHKTTKSMPYLISQSCGDLLPADSLSRGDGTTQASFEHSWTSDKAQK